MPTPKRRPPPDRAFGPAYTELWRPGHAVPRTTLDATSGATDLLLDAWFRLQRIVQLRIDRQPRCTRLLVTPRDRGLARAWLAEAVAAKGAT